MKSRRLGWDISFQRLEWNGTWRSIDGLNSKRAFIFLKWKSHWNIFDFWGNFWNFSTLLRRVEFSCKETSVRKFWMSYKYFSAKSKESSLDPLRCNFVELIIPSSFFFSFRIVSTFVFFERTSFVSELVSRSFVECARVRTLLTGVCAGPRTRPSIEKVDLFNRPLLSFFIHWNSFERLPPLDYYLAISAYLLLSFILFYFNNYSSISLVRDKIISNSNSSRDSIPPNFYYFLD